MIKYIRVINLDKKITYFLDDDHDNILIKFVYPVDFFVFRKGDIDWVLLPPDSSYMREVFIGQGNNCMTQISETEAKKYMERLLVNDIHPDVKKSIEALFPSTSTTN